MSADSIMFGKQMKALRGSRSQTEVENLSGVPTYQISKIESGTIQNPTFETIVKLCRVYGVEPNEVAAMMGLWPTPEVNDNEAIVPEAQRVVTMIQNMLMSIDPEQQLEFAMLLNGVVRIEQAEISRSKEPTEPDSILPGFLRGRGRRQ